MTILREHLLDGQWVERIQKEMRAAGGFEPLSEAEREASLQRILAEVEREDDVWVFGYGSLIWNPMLRLAGRCQGRVYGYHRRYCFWTTLGRGSPRCPGLMLALDRGGSCQGMLLQVAPGVAEEELRLLWMREMLSGVYHPRWVTAHNAQGRRCRAITFVINRAHSQYCRHLPADQAAWHIAHATGRLGSCMEYLQNTIEHLESLNIRDAYLQRLHRLSEKLQQEDGEPAALLDRPSHWIPAPAKRPPTRTSP